MKNFLQFFLTLTVFVISFEYEKQPVRKTTKNSQQQTTRVIRNGISLDCTGGT